jgi:hypothetical protein
MRDVEREWHASEHHQRVLEPATPLFRERAADRGRAEGHREEQQAGRIFRRVEEIEDGGQHALVRLPGIRLAIDVESPQRDEQRGQTEAPAD